MTACEARLDPSDEDDGGEGGDEEVRRKKEGQPRFARTPEIDDRQQHQNREAQRQRERQKRWGRRNERADARRDPDGHVEHVIERERSAREQRRRLAEVLLRNRVRPSSVRVRRDRLPVREVHDEQHADDDRADRKHVGEAEHAYGQQQRERRLRPVRCGRERVEAEHRYAGDWPDLLFLFVGRRQSATKDHVSQRARFARMRRALDDRHDRCAGGSRGVRRGVGHGVTVTMLGYEAGDRPQEPADDRPAPAQYFDNGGGGPAVMGLAWFGSAARVPGDRRFDGRAASVLDRRRGVRVLRRRSERATQRRRSAALGMTPRPWLVFPHPRSVRLDRPPPSPMVRDARVRRRQVVGRAAKREFGRAKRRPGQFP